MSSATEQQISCIDNILTDLENIRSSLRILEKAEGISTSLLHCTRVLEGLSAIRKLEANLSRLKSGLIDPATATYVDLDSFL